MTLLILVAFFSTIFGLLLPFLYFQLKLRKLRKKAIAKMEQQVPMFGRVRPGATCDTMDIGRHDWKFVPIAKKEDFDPNNPEAQDTLVCMKCGVMSGSDNQFSQQGLEVLKRNIEAMESQKAFAEEVEEFKKNELERLYYSYMERTGMLPDKNGFYRQLFDYATEATLEVDMKIAQKIQQRQMDILASAFQRQQ